MQQLTAAQKEFIRLHENDDIRQLALRFGGDDMPFLLTQLAGRQTAKLKIPSWYANDEIVYPAHVSLEQASSEITARYKASLLPFDKRRFVDLTGGLGVDFSFLSAYFREAVYVERMDGLCEMAEHNFRKLGLKNVSVHQAHGEEFLREMPVADVVYLDPSRRDESGKKVFRMEDCLPDVVEIKNLLMEKADMVLVKYSPMLDISLAVKMLGYVQEVHAISVDNECKEVLFLLSKDARSALYSAVNLSKTDKIQTFTFSPDEENRVSDTSRPERFLYEPNASVLKIGAFNSLANRFGIKKLHKNSHLYTSDNFLPDFPGRIFKIKEVFAPNKGNIRSFLSETKKANVSVRNFPMSVAEIRKKTGLKEGGDTYVFATTLADGQKVWVVCEKNIT